VDILRCLASEEGLEASRSRGADSLLEERIGDIAVWDVVAVGSEGDVGEAVCLMRDRGIGSVSVT
jgi:hypothetical protein